MKIQRTYHIKQEAMYQMEVNEVENVQTKLQLNYTIKVSSEELLKFFVGLATLSLILIVLLLPGTYVSFSSIWVRLIAMLSVSFVFGTAVWGIYRLVMESKQAKFMEASTPVVAEAESKKYERSHIDPEEVLIIQNKLKSAMEQDHLYLKADLKLEDLAAHVNFAKHIITQVLNEFMHVNFYQFVNNYRLEEFKLRVRQDKDMDYTILAHAFDSGFQSKSSFNKVFKEYYNMTPSQYRRGLTQKQAS